MLHRLGIPIEAKPFSIGVRIEHPQDVIDRAQYGRPASGGFLGPAEYKLVHHCETGRSAYTFCMCPGGEVIACSSESGGVVTNGMSFYSRNRPNANSALLALRSSGNGSGKPLRSEAIITLHPSSLLAIFLPAGLRIRLAWLSRRTDPEPRLATLENACPDSSSRLSGLQFRRWKGSSKASR